MSDLISDEDLARFVKFARDKYDSPAHRTMMINTVNAISKLPLDELPEVSEDEIEDIISDLPTEYEAEEEN